MDWQSEQEAGLLHSFFQELKNILIIPQLPMIVKNITSIVTKYPVLTAFHDDIQTFKF